MAKVGVAGTAKRQKHGSAGRMPDFRAHDRRKLILRTRLQKPAHAIQAVDFGKRERGESQLLRLTANVLDGRRAHAQGIKRAHGKMGEHDSSFPRSSTKRSATEW